MTDSRPRDAEPAEEALFAMRGSSCVSPDLLQPWRAGTLPPGLATQVEAHLTRCATCRALLDAAGALEAEAGPTPEESARITAAIWRGRGRASVGRVRRWQPVWLGAAAAAVVAALGLAFILSGSPEMRPLVGAPSHDIVLQSTDAFALALQKPPTELPPDALVLRSGGRSPYVEALSAALEPWRWNRFGEAAPKFRDVTVRYPDRPHAFFYLGVSLLMAGHAADAVAPLERARALASDDPSLREAATWYLAVALERHGETAAAVQALADLCAEGAARRDEACRGLAAMRPLPGRPASEGWQKDTSVGADHVDRDRDAGEPAAAGRRRSMPLR